MVSGQGQPLHGTPGAVNLLIRPLKFSIKVSVLNFSHDLRMRKRCRAPSCPGSAQIPPAKLIEGFSFSQNMLLKCCPISSEDVLYYFKPFLLVVIATFNSHVVLKGLE